MITSPTVLYRTIVLSASSIFDIRSKRPSPSTQQDTRHPAILYAATYTLTLSLSPPYAMDTSDPPWKDFTQSPHSFFTKVDFNRNKSFVSPRRADGSRPLFGARAALKEGMGVNLISWIRKETGVKTMIPAVEMQLPLIRIGVT